MPRLPEPCLTCGRLTTNGSRCELHQQALDARYQLARSQRKKETGQYSGQYARLAKIVRDTAIICHLCGKPFQQGDQIEADHLTPGTPVVSLEQLAPAHALCNQRRGNKPLQ